MADESKARILHQDDVEDVIDHLVDADVETDNTRDDETYAARGTSVIASPTAPGAAYVQAEAASAKTAIDAIRAALTAAGITA